jgi:hypothetical protein
MVPTAAELWCVFVKYGNVRSGQCANRQLSNHCAYFPGQPRFGFVVAVRRHNFRRFLCGWDRIILDRPAWHHVHSRRSGHCNVRVHRESNLYPACSIGPANAARIAIAFASSSGHSGRIVPNHPLPIPAPGWREWKINGLDGLPLGGVAGRIRRSHGTNSTGARSSRKSSTVFAPPTQTIWKTPYLAEVVPMSPLPSSP